MTMTAVLILAASAQGKSENKREVTVYYTDNASVPYLTRVQAQGLASTMFAGIGVTLNWRHGAPSHAEPGAIAIDFVTHTPETLMPGALAYALPYEGVHIRIFWDRIGSDRTGPELLAHVMVHEITHILQGVVQHSSEGIMKARWTPQDRSSLARKPLHFTEFDVVLIHNGLDARGATVEIASK
jgi:hypothetical protein